MFCQSVNKFYICDALRYLDPFIQINTPLWVFFTFFTYKCIKSCKASHIASKLFLNVVQISMVGSHHAGINISLLKRKDLQKLDALKFEEGAPPQST